MNICKGRKKPLWFLERLSLEEGAAIKKAFQNTDYSLKEAYTYFCEGGLDKAMERYWLSIKQIGEETKLRDINIGRNITTAEGRIHSRYPKLKDKQLLDQGRH